jgi:hypothetical protein
MRWWASTVVTKVFIDGPCKISIERNAIALLSNHGKAGVDRPSAGWLGRRCNRERVRRLGLWKSNHVEDDYEAGF